MQEIIEVIYVNRRNKKEKLKGYIDGNRFLSKRKKLKGYVEGDRCYNSMQQCLIVDDDNIIKWEDGTKKGFIKDFKIYNFNNYLYYELLKNERKILVNDRYWFFKLNGNLDKLDEITFVGFCLAFEDLFVW